MRFLNGIVVGVFLAIAAAYVHDRTVVGEPDAAARTVVNWDAFGQSASTLTDWVQGQVSALKEAVHRRT